MHQTFLFVFKIERHEKAKWYCVGASLWKELKVLMYLGKQILWRLWVDLGARGVA